MTKKPTRKILHDFEITEISAVDRPAQAPALASITKALSEDVNALDEKLAEGFTDYLFKMYIDPANGPVSFATAVSEDLKQREFYQEIDKIYPYLNALETSVRSIAGDATIDSDQRYTMVRNQVEGFMSVLKDRWVTMDEALTLYADVSKEDTMPDKVEKNTEAQVQIDDLTKKLEATELQLKTFKAVADLTAEESDFYKSLDTAGKEAFLAKSKEERAVDLHKSVNDETVTIEGRTVRKSVIGEDTFAIMKAQSERIEKAEKLAKEERERRELGEFAKAADENYGNLPGTSFEKAKALAAISKCSADVQETIEKMFKAGAAGAVEAFKDLGTTGVVEKKADTSEHTFLAKVEAIAGEQKLNRVDAMAKARKQYPDEFQAYREAEAAA